MRNEERLANAEGCHAIGFTKRARSVMGMFFRQSAAIPALICIGESSDFRRFIDLLAEQDPRFSASVGRKVGAVGYLNQAVPIDNVDDLAPSTDEIFALESLYRPRHKRSVHAKHDGEKAVC